MDSGWDFVATGVVRILSVYLIKNRITRVIHSFFHRYDPRVVPGQVPTSFVISLNSTDKIRMIGAPPDVTQCVRDTINIFWSRGIQREEDHYGAWEFKLRGTPWWADGTEAVHARFLITKIIEALLARGWMIKIGVDVTRKDQDKSVLIFQRSTVPPASIFCLSLNETDKLRLINAPQDVIDTFRITVKSKWVFGIKREGPYAQSYEMKVNENPWSYGMSGHDGAHGRVLLCYLLHAFAQLGWRHVLSADVSAKYIHQDNGPDYPYDVHSWWFMHDPTVTQNLSQTQYGLGHQYGPPVGLPQEFAAPPPVVPGYLGAPAPQHGFNYPSAPGQQPLEPGYPQAPYPDSPPTYDEATKNW